MCQVGLNERHRDSFSEYLFNYLRSFDGSSRYPPSSSMRSLTDKQKTRAQTNSCTRMLNIHTQTITSMIYLENGVCFHGNTAGIMMMMLMIKIT